MVRIPVVKPTQLIRALEQAGFEFIRSKGAHRLYRRGKLIVVVAYHNKEFKRKTLLSILKQADMSLEDLRSKL